MVCSCVSVNLLGFDFFFFFFFLQISTDWSKRIAWKITVIGTV